MEASTNKVRTQDPHTHIDLGRSAIEDEQECEDKSQVIDSEEYEEVVLESFDGPERRASSVIKEDIYKYGMTGGCRGCGAIARGWERPAARSEECRSRTLKHIFEDGDKERRVQHATKKMLEHQEPSVGCALVPSSLRPLSSSILPISNACPSTITFT